MFAMRSAIRSAAVVARAASRAAPVAVPMMRFPALALRSYSASALSDDDIRARILDVLKSFEKVDPAKVHLVSHPR